MKKKRKYRLKHISKKEEINKSHLREVYAEMDETQDLICSGCGQREFLSHAHIISQRNKKLQADPLNIVFDCMERVTPDLFGNLGCHQRWESGNWDKIATLQNAQYRLDFVKMHDTLKYRKILSTNEQRRSGNTSKGVTSRNGEITSKSMD